MDEGKEVNESVVKNGTVVAPSILVSSDVSGKKSYDGEILVSQPTLSDKSSLLPDALELRYSFVLLFLGCNHRRNISSSS